MVKGPKEQLVVSQAALASRKNKIKEKVYQKYKDGDKNKYGWLRQKSEVVEKNHSIWLRQHFMDKHNHLNQPG